MNSGHKGLIIEIAERLKKNISTLGCEEPRTYHSKYNFRQELVNSKLISTCPEDHLSQFFRKKFKTLESYSNFERQFFGRLSKLHFTCSEEHLKRNVEKLINIWTFWTLSDRFSVLWNIFKCTWRVQKIILGKKLIFIEKSYKSEFFSGFEQKKFRKGCQNCIRRVQRKFLG